MIKRLLKKIWGFDVVKISLIILTVGLAGKGLEYLGLIG